MKKVKYYYSIPVHIRTLPVVTDAQGNPVYIPKIKPTKVRNAPRITVAAIWNTTTNEITFGSSVCSPKDVFSKAVGREIAFKRANKFPEVKVVVTRKNKIGRISKRYAEQLIETHLGKYVQSDF